MEVPAHIRIEIPVEEFGDAYAGQWVERRQRIGRSTVVELEGIKDVFKDPEQFAKISEVLATIFTDWTIGGDEGPLPKPWGNPEAFEALVESDLDLALWVLNLVPKPMLQLVQPSKN